MAMPIGGSASGTAATGSGSTSGAAATGSSSTSGAAAMGSSMTATAACIRLTAQCKGYQFCFLNSQSFYLQSA